MNIVGCWACGVLVIPFGIVGILFAIFKAKAAKFVGGRKIFCVYGEKSSLIRTRYV